LKSGPNNMPFIALLVFALLPSLIWLWFFLKRDPKPEPRHMILRVFLIGVLMVVPAIGAQIILNRFWFGLVAMTLMAAAVEEAAKYGAARWGAFGSVDFDEPVDAMIYMIIAGLGFAAMENLLVLISPSISGLSMIAGVSGLRFLTATFVHALSAGLMGYFVSLQIFREKRGLAWMGLLVAALIHAAYNLSIIGLAAQIDNYKYLVYTLLLIIPLGIGILDLIAFAHLKKIDQDG